MKYRFFILSVLAILCSCGLQRSTTAPSPAESRVITQPEIMFLHLKVWKNESGYGARMVDKKQVAGQLHQDLRGLQLAEGAWLVSFLDKKGGLVSQVMINNPLEEHYETTDEQGRLRGVEVKKAEADCFIRAQYDPRFSGAADRANRPRLAAG